MEEILSSVTGLAVEILVIVVGSILALVANKAKKYLDNLRKKDELGIIDLITDRVVEYAEAELVGESGKVKRDFAVARALEILESKGIKVNEEEVIAGIENGVVKLKMNKQFLTPFQSGMNPFQ